MEGTIVRRVIPSDNSCLFNAVGYVMDHDKQKAAELRQRKVLLEVGYLDVPFGSRELFAASMASVHLKDIENLLNTVYKFHAEKISICKWDCFLVVIAATVASDPVKYNEAFLGKSNEEYCNWILDPDKWGGAIELSILSQYYGREIAAYDIQTLRCDLYGQEKKYQERVMLIYDGLHYDALAMSPAEEAPEEFDQTIFPVNKDRTIGAVENLALHLVKDANRKRSYTDTANFTLRCGVCQAGLIGQKEAVEHAQATGHVNFQEYR